MARRTLASVVCWLLASFAWLASAEAHVPHDDVQTLALSPNFDQDRTVFAVVRGSMFKSTDGGFRWRRIVRGLGGPAWRGRLAVSPDFASDQTLFLATGRRLLRSTDGGESFVSLPRLERELLDLTTTTRFTGDDTLLGIDKQGALVRSTDRGESWAVLRSEPRLTTLAWDASRLLCGTAQGRVEASADDGASWSNVAHLSEESPITSLVSGGESGAIYFATEAGSVHAAGDGSLEDLSAPLGGGAVMSLARVLREGKPRLLATTWGNAVFASDDGGRSWTLTSDRLFTSDQADEFDRPHFTALTTSRAGTVFLASFCGIYRTDDQGELWYKLETTFDHIVGVDVVSSEEGQLELVLSTYGAGAFLSSDLGRTWKVCNTGLSHPRLGPIALSPSFHTDGTAFAGTYGRFYRSSSSGSWWAGERMRISSRSVQAARTRVERWSRERSQLLGKLMHRAGPIYEPSYLPPTPIAFGVSPTFASDRTLFVGMHPNGLLKSTDGGAQFDLVWPSQQEPSRTVVLSPAYESDRTLFVGAGDGAWRSNDDGRSWVLLGEDLELTQPVIAVSPAFQRDRTLFIGSTEGVFRSRDGGDTWSLLGGNRRVRRISGIAVSPDFERDGLLMAQELSGDLLIGQVGDAEVSWRRSGLSHSGRASAPIVQREGAHLLKFSPNFANDRTLFAASLYTLMVSSDAGETWDERPRPLRYDIGTTMEHGFYMPVYFEGRWEQTGPAEDGPPGPSSLGAASNETAARVTLTFVGSSVRWIGARGADLGIASVFVDGEPQVRVDQFAATRTFEEVLFTSGELQAGPHEITIEVTGERNESATGTRIDVNAFEVTR